MKTVQADNKTTIVIQHEFDAPKQMVFEAFSTAEALAEWWGPVECKNAVLSLDFREGGIFHFKMDMQGHISYGRFIFGKIQPYDLLEFSNAFADANARPVKAPFDIDLPLEIFYRLVFTEKNSKTTITLTGEPVNASKNEDEAFRSIDAGMRKGFGATFHKLAEYLIAKH